jgi:AcrR family transcriptional regulator
MDYIPMSSDSLRAKGKAKRYDDIVSAAADLWRKHGIDGVSPNQIAAAAEVAPQTIYNLIGGIDAIGFAVIKKGLERLDVLLGQTPVKGIALAMHSAKMSAELYTKDSRLYRQVIVRIPRVLFDGTHLGRDTANTAIQAMIQAKRAGEIVQTVDAGRLGRTMYVNYMGALYDWACGDSGDAQFLRAAEVAVLAPAVACASPTTRPMLSQQLFAALAQENDTVAVSEY